MSDILVLDKVSANRGSVRILHDVSVSVGNETLAVFGLNGSGKSTLLRVISGLTPSSGRTVHEGTDISGQPAYKRVRRGFAFVKQDNQLFLDLTVRENLELGAYLVSKRQIATEIDRTLDLCPQLADKLDRFAGSLSGGERQVLAIAKALIRMPKLLLIDEPSAGVSAGSLQIFEDLFRRLRTLHIPIVIVEQHLGFGTAIADRAVILRLGRVQQELTTDELRADPDCVGQALTGEMY